MSYFDFSAICLKKIKNCQNIILVNILINASKITEKLFSESNRLSENEFLQVLNNMRMDKFPSNDKLTK